jgi:large subunit ribosomal protein L17
VFGGPIRVDDLTLVDGIVPAAAAVLQDAGIRTWARLAATDRETLRSILERAGPAFGHHDPTTWPEQAALARDGHWQALKQLQQRLSV